MKKALKTVLGFILGYAVCEFIARVTGLPTFAVGIIAVALAIATVSMSDRRRHNGYNTAEIRAYKDSNLTGGYKLVVTTQDLHEFARRKESWSNAKYAHLAYLVNGGQVSGYEDALFMMGATRSVNNRWVYGGRFI